MIGQERIPLSVTDIAKALHIVFETIQHVFKLDRLRSEPRSLAELRVGCACMQQWLAQTQLLNRGKRQVLLYAI